MSNYEQLKEIQRFFRFVHDTGNTYAWKTQIINNGFTRFVRIFFAANGLSSYFTKFVEWRGNDWYIDTLSRKKSIANRTYGIIIKQMAPNGVIIYTCTMSPFSKEDKQEFPEFF